MSQASKRRHFNSFFFFNAGTAERKLSGGINGENERVPLWLSPIELTPGRTAWPGGWIRPHETFGAAWCLPLVIPFPMPLVPSPPRGEPSTGGSHLSGTSTTGKGTSPRGVPGCPHVGNEDQLPPSCHRLLQLTKPEAAGAKNLIRPSYLQWK